MCPIRSRYGHCFNAAGPRSPISARTMCSSTPRRIDYGRVLVTIGVRSREPIVELLRSRVFFEWFDAAGVEDIPAVFAGEIVERFGSVATSARTVPGVVVAAMASVDDVVDADRRGPQRDGQVRAAGIRETGLFRAFDDDHEVLIMQEFATRRARGAGSNIPTPPPVDCRAGKGAYPPLFVGQIFDMMRIEDK